MEAEEVRNAFTTEPILGASVLFCFVRIAAGPRQASHVRAVGIPAVFASAFRSNRRINSDVDAGDGGSGALLVCAVRNISKTVKPVVIV